jgi:hypothetical protein
MKLKWHHDNGLYLSKYFRIFRERLPGRKTETWCLSDIRNGVKSAPSWFPLKTAKEAKELAELVFKKPYGFYHKNRGRDD